MRPSTCPLSPITGVGYFLVECDIANKKEPLDIRNFIIGLAFATRMVPATQVDLYLHDWAGLGYKNGPRNTGIHVNVGNCPAHMNGNLINKKALTGFLNASAKSACWQISYKQSKNWVSSFKCAKLQKSKADLMHLNIPVCNLVDVVIDIFIGSLQTILFNSP